VSANSTEGVEYKAWDWATVASVKRCPTCKTPIEKNGGCNNMYCTACGTAFQWTDAGKLGELSVPATRFGQDLSKVKLTFSTADWEEDMDTTTADEVKAGPATGLPGLWGKLKDMLRTRSE
jgi:hypothetical protein